MEGYNSDICYACATGFRIVLDFVFLFVEFAFAEEVIDRFVILRVRVERDKMNGVEGAKGGSDVRFRGIVPR